MVRLGASPGTADEGAALTGNVGFLDCTDDKSFANVEKARGGADLEK